MKNHFAKVCRSKRKIDMIHQDFCDPSEEDLDAVMNEDDKDDSIYTSELNIGAISVSQRAVEEIKCREWTEQILLNGRKTLCKIDTGAECNVISSVVTNLIFYSHQSFKHNSLLSFFQAWCWFDVTLPPGGCPGAP